MKKILIIIAAVGLIAGFITGIFIASSESTTDVRYEVVGSEAKITEITFSGRKIEIPETVDGYTVTSVGEWAVRSNVSGIGDGNPLFINLFEGVTLYIPKTLKSLDAQAFASSFDVTKFKVDKDNEYFSNDSDGVLYNKDKTELVQYPLRKTDKSYKTDENTVKIREYAFQQATFVEKITVNEGVKEIGDRAFFNVHNLKKVSLPESLESVGIQAFDSNSIEEINIPNEIKTLGKGAFGGCKMLETVVLPDTLVEIPENLFGMNSNFKKIEIGASVEKIAVSTFEYCNNLAEIAVDENNKFFTTDGKGALYNKDMTELLFCANAVSGDFVIPNTVEKISAGAFKLCVNLKSITVSGTVSVIGNEAFFESGIEKIVFENGSAVKEIPMAAFANCLSLKEAVLPESLKVIGIGAFDGCEKLASIEIPETVEKIESSAFLACESIGEIKVPDSVTSIGKNALGYNRYRIGNYTGNDAVSALDNFKIICSEGSAAEKYAEENGFKTTVA